MIIIKPENVKLWADSKDYMLEALAAEYVNNPMPPEEELISLLTFYNIFSIGYRELGLDELADIYGRRADLFASGLTQLGLSTASRKEYVRNRMVPGMAKRIVQIACGRAAYTMVDIERYKTVKKEKETDGKK